MSAYTENKYQFFLDLVKKCEEIFGKEFVLSQESENPFLVIDKLADRCLELQEKIKEKSE